MSLNIHKQRKAKASYFSSFLLDNLKKTSLENINSIILFGSVAREQANKESDIDIFIDALRKTPKINAEVKELLLRFEKEPPVYVENSIKIRTGKLTSEEFADLLEQILHDGIVLWGKYTIIPNKMEPSTIFWWEGIKNASKRTVFNRELHGRTIKGKKTPGLLLKLEGQRIGRNTILIPSRYSPIFKKFAKKIGMKYSSIRMGYKKKI